jgi:uncharacterized membrane protein YfcA
MSLLSSFCWSSAWLLPVGLVIGAYGTLIGAGGGFLLMPLLILVYPSESPSVMTAISLAMICANAASGTYAYARQKRVDFGLGIWYALASIPGAFLGERLVKHIPRKEFNLSFGVVLFIVALYLMLRPGRRGVSHAEEEAAIEKFIQHGVRPYSFWRAFWIGVPLSMVVGVLSSLLGIGGGIIHVPALSNLLYFPVHMATATSHFVLFFTTAAGTVAHAIDGTLWPGLDKAIWLSVGVIPGAQIGAKLSQRLKGAWIIRGLAMALAIVGVRIVLLAIYR